MFVRPSCGKNPRILKSSNVDVTSLYPRSSKSQNLRFRFQDSRNNPQILGVELGWNYFEDFFSVCFACDPEVDYFWIETVSYRTSSGSGILPKTQNCCNYRSLELNIWKKVPNFPRTHFF